MLSARVWTFLLFLSANAPAAAQLSQVDAGVASVPTGGDEAAAGDSETAIELVAADEIVGEGGEGASEPPAGDAAGGGGGEDERGEDEGGEDEGGEDEGGEDEGGEDEGEGSAEERTVEEGRSVEIAPFGMVEAFFLWSFRDPDNGIVALRGFDNRHGSFTLANVVFGSDFAYRDAYARIALQWGHTPTSYYGAEPSDLGGLGVGSTSPELWQVIQEAYVGYRASIGDYVVPMEAGVFLSPVGNESLNIAGQWHFSRSSLFYGLPFYHSGVRSRVEVGAFTLGVGVFNGINQIVDRNRNKSVIAHVGWGSERAHAQLLYLGGHEQPHGTPGRSWRHLLDFTFDWSPHPLVSFRG